ncbi:SusC/RagA family TonB-linked outer membrane protein [Membranihabitans maritimus]|uniref:SusC/RagA family TonB-linked outer membrane protein n=1 Tax=Membranihabitans maritimus TaxID=2904244 RepID=UPI001F2DB3AC|nr:TonB-dependent receptor [Membranihabitans maritimus]
MGFLKRIFILTIVGIVGGVYPSQSQESFTMLSVNNLDLQNKAEKVELKQVIKEIEERYKVNFAYQSGLLDGKFIILSDNQTMPLGQRLNYYLNQNSLDYQKIGERNYVIYKKKPRKNIEKGVAPYLKKDNYYYIKYSWEESEPPIQGTVVDEEGEPLIGATVQVKESPGKGAITDFEGKFSFDDVDGGATLIVSFVGYETIEVPVNNQGELTITLAQNSELLDEVVVVGYGVQKKVDVTGAVGTLKGEDVADRKAVQVSQALQGSMPGVMVTRGNNAPGATANIKIRGVTTIGNSNPLIIVDGVPVDNINDINPNDIEDISVLKDAASASIYGSRAAAGVILVTTKRAEDGQFNLSYDVNYGIEQPTALPDYVGLERYMEMTNELRWNDNGNNADEFPTYSEDLVNNYRDLNQENPNLYPITDWVDLIMKKNAPRQSHVLSMSGGTKALKTNASIAYDFVEALYDGRTYDRITARVNNDIEINDYLRAKVDLNYKLTNSEQPNIDPMYNMLIAAPIYAAMWDDGRVASGKTGNNIYGSLKYGGFNDQSYQAIGGRLALDFEPIKNLVFSGVFSPNIRYDKGKNFRKQVPYYAADDPTALEGYLQWNTTTRLAESRNEGERYTTQFLANYNADIGKHSLGLLGGYENFYSRNESLNASRDQYTLTSFPYLDQGPLELRDNGGGAYESAYRSFFGRITYNYDSKYFVQANIRRDGSSRFHEDYRWGSFPSISTGWVISREPFLANNPVLSFLKLRASWGNLGNERIGNYPYQATIAFSNALFYRGNEVVSELTAAQWAYAIQNITWEKTESYDVGVDVNFLEDRLQVTADYFYKTTKDMLLALEIPDYIGFDNPDQNTGVMKSVGWEFQAAWQDYIGDFDYSVSFNLSDFTSTMGDLGGTEFLGDKIKIKGSEFDEWYGYKTDGLFQTQEEVENSATINANVAPGDVKYVDISGPDGEPDGTISPEYDRVLLGGSLPQMIFGGNIKLGYKDISLRVAFQGVGKQNARIDPIMVRPLSENWGNIPAILEGNYWSHYNTDQENMQAKYPRLTRVNESSNLTMSDYWLFDGGYFRIKNITLGYDLPKTIFKSVGIEGINAFASASDLFTISNYPKGWDPEVSSTGYPITTQLLFGLSVKF